MNTEGTKDIGTQQKGTEGTRILSESSKGRLVRFLFCPPALGPLPAGPRGFARRLAHSPVDLVAKVGMVRSNAYYAAGCPLELCDHAAARDLWRVIYAEAIGNEVLADGKQEGVWR